MRSLFPSNLELLQKNLELRGARHSILTSNVVNAETPGYIAKDVQFEAALRDVALRHTSASEEQRALARTHSRHLPGLIARIADVRGTLVARPSDDVGKDLNTVSMDEEMGKLTTNTFHYNASAEILGRMFEGLKRTISEGGR